MRIAWNKRLVASDDTPRWQVWGCLLLLYVGVYLVAGDDLAISTWRVHADGNAALGEAQAWHQGTLELERSYYEDAEFDGHRYNVVGLAFVLIAYVCIPISEWLGAPPGSFAAPLYVALIALPIPLLAYWAFRSVLKSPAWAALMAGYLVLGTAMLPALQILRGGSIYRINHALAIMGVLLIGGDLLGRRRIWPAVLGLVLAVWSRQMTCFYAIPLLWIAWRYPAGEDPGDSALRAGSPSSTSPEPDAPTQAVSRTSSVRRRFTIALLGVLIVAAVPMTLNTVKFGNPFQTGYRHLYDGREDRVARDVHTQFYGPNYYLRHLKAMHLSFPDWDIRGGTLYPVLVGKDGGSIWFCSPLFLALFVFWPKWWRDPRQRVLMLGSFLVMLGIMGYHTTGGAEKGYYRYSLDFLPLWLLVIAPHIMKHRYGLYATMACFAYSALYFEVLTGCSG